MSMQAVAVMKLNDEFLAVRGGLTTGHWSEREAEIVGSRLEAEISGVFIQTMSLAVREAFSSFRTVTVSEYFAQALGDNGRTLRQYKADPLVSGDFSEVE
jgi:hypothetical protein